jgi:hypothetical protein
MVSTTSSKELDSVPVVQVREEKIKLSDVVVRILAAVAVCHMCLAARFIEVELSWD